MLLQWVLVLILPFKAASAPRECTIYTAVSGSQVYTRLGYFNSLIDNLHYQEEMASGGTNPHLDTVLEKCYTGYRHHKSMPLILSHATKKRCLSIVTILSD